MKSIRKYAFIICIVLAMAIGSAKYLSHLSTVSNNVNGRELPIYSVETEKKQVALTFDAAWGNDDVYKILGILKEHDVKVTFFMTGGWVSEYPDEVKAIYEAGHDLGNHSENHKNMSQLSIEQQKNEIMEVHNKVKELTGVEMNLFRAPYGDYNDQLILNAKDCGYYTLQWDVDTLDVKRSVYFKGVHQFIHFFYESYCKLDINLSVFLKNNLLH
ncbi:MAG: polysaccharide deacetylase family protein [Lachnospiraceae bacterium]